MNQTANYHLNLWESSDRILREDFNGDNAKLDAALKANADAIAAEASARADAVAAEAAARASGDLTDKLLDITTEAETTYISADLSGVDLSPYRELEVVADIQCERELQMRVNGGRSYTAPTSSGGSAIDYFAAAGSYPGSKNQIRARIFAREGGTLCGISDNIAPNSYQRLVCWWGGTMAGIRTLDFQGVLSNGVLPTMEAGGRITVYGFKR